MEQMRLKLDRKNVMKHINFVPDMLMPSGGGDGAPCANIMSNVPNIMADVSVSVKLTDFGLAKATEFEDLKSCEGTALWMAPEVVNQRGNGYGLAADIWSLGCTVLEMLTRELPYSHLEGFQALFQIGKGELPQVPETLSKDARDFIPPTISTFGSLQQLNKKCSREKNSAENTTPMNQ